MVELEEGYSGIEIASQYGDTEQRWLVVDSAKTREKNLAKAGPKEISSAVLREGETADLYPS